MSNKYQFDKLLKKKSWTGKEVGKLLIASMLNDIKQLGQKEKTLLFSQSDFEKIESSITSDRDYITYGVYRDLYTAIIDSFNRGQSLYQQFYNGFHRLLFELRETQNTDTAQANMDRTPLIMTDSQYKRLKAKAVKTLSGYKESFCSLMFDCLYSFLGAKKSYAKKEAPAIWKAIEATKKIPATGNRFLPLYNATYGNGYYSLPDGRRSDQMTREEWENILQEEFFKNHKLFINGETATAKETIKEYNERRHIKGYELFFKGTNAVRKFVLEQTGKELDGTDEEIEKAIYDVTENNIRFNPKAEQIAEALDFSPHTKWHTYEEPPENLTLYDLLELYINEFQVVYEDKKALKHLKEDIPNLYDALKNYIENKVPQARGLKANQLYKYIISWGELAAANFTGFRETLNPSDSDIINIATEGEDTTENKSKRLRTTLRGIAILQNPSESQIDEKGDYIEEENPRLFLHSLHTLEKETTTIENLHGYIDNLIYPALAYLYAFNSLMEIISKVYDLPELVEVVRYDTKLFESKMEGFNTILYIFYHEVYGNEAEKQRKRAIIKKVFRPLEADILKPSQKAIEEITEELTKLGFSSDARKKLKYLDAFIDRLTSSREEAS